jgi:hypothetical protein
MDEEIRRVNILEINPDGSGEKVFASGLRNPNGMDWQPETGALWTAVNGLARRRRRQGRDRLGALVRCARGEEPADPALRARSGQLDDREAGGADSVYEIP